MGIEANVECANSPKRDDHPYTFPIPLMIAAVKDANDNQVAALHPVGARKIVEPEEPPVVDQRPTRGAGNAVVDHTTRASVAIDDATRACAARRVRRAVVVPLGRIAPDVEHRAARECERLANRNAPVPRAADAMGRSRYRRFSEEGLNLQRSPALRRIKPQYRTVSHRQPLIVRGDTACTGAGKGGEHGYNNP